MAYNDNQNENELPTGNVKKTSSQFLPRYFRSDFNKKFLQSTIDQFISNGNIEKINDYVGKRSARSVIEQDTFLPDVSKEREDYQLEPALVNFDEVNNVTFFKDYNDFLNQLKVFGADTTNHNRLNQQEFYSWDPKIDFDKFTNFREYYWLPNGPSAITVVGQEEIIESTYTVKLGDDLDNTPYIFDPNGLTRNPTLTLYKGRTYRFEVDCKDAPLFFRTSNINDDDYNFGMAVNNGAEEGIIEINLLDTAPDTLYYINGNDQNQSGIINVLKAEDASSLDVELEILGKKNFKLSNNVEISNGMKLNFAGKTNPSKYEEGNWYVEGVGNSIVLVSDKDLEIPAKYSDATQVEFDNVPFDSIPFSDQATFAGTKDYIVINRSSPEKSQWSRYNRWYHKDVIETSAKITNTTAELNQDNRAFKPIIEFNSGLKLYNYGTRNITNVDLIDTFTNDVFSIIEGQQGYNIDGVNLVDGMKIIFNADPDIRVLGKIYQVKFINFKNNNQLTLVELESPQPVLNDTVLVQQGTNNSGTVYWFNGSKWIKAQEKTAVNQCPLFDLFDEDGNSFADETVYNATSFKGNKIFSYSEGTGTNDDDLGFPLSYRTIENTGDLLFNFNFIKETYNYTTSNLLLTEKISSNSYVRVYDRIGNYTTENAWKKSKVTNTQRIVLQYFANIDNQNDFEINCFDTIPLDVTAQVYVDNDLKFENTDYNLVNENNKLYVRFLQNQLDKSITIKVSSKQDKNSNGTYEIPINLERNPKNEELPEFTFGEVADHVLSIVEEHPKFSGIFPGTGNLRDLPDNCLYGKKVVRHSSPFMLSGYHILNKDANIIKSLRYAKREYSKFKRLLLQTAMTLGYEGSAGNHLNIILGEITKNKTNTMPFYFSDMIAYKGFVTVEHLVKDSRILNYPMNQQFSLTNLTDKSVLVYKNDILLTHGKDYTFNQDFVKLTEVSRNDTIKIQEYETTNGSFVPPTPTKLGLYPATEPLIFVDNTYQTPTKMIQGHDGSLTRAYDDFRDDIILEFETRIYNNLKVSYNTRFFDYDKLYVSAERKDGLSLESLNTSLSIDFGQWLTFTGGVDYQKNSYLNLDNAFTYNYNNFALFNNDPAPGFWRGVFNYVYDTDRPHTHPWEMLGFSVKPNWWEEQYGPAPYTDGNMVLWSDIAQGKIKKPGVPVTTIKTKIRPWLLTHIPVTEFGTLKTPLEAGLIKQYSNALATGDFRFGDMSPVENAWRKSSEYPFALLAATIVNYPHLVFATGFDKSRQVVSSQDQIVYNPTNNQITMQDIIFPNIATDTSKSNTIGLINYIQNYLTSKSQIPISVYQNELTNIDIRICSKLGGFTNKDNFKLILDSRTPLNEGNVFVPSENYDIFLNTSSPINQVIYSGVIIEKLENGYSVKGYDKEKSLFYINEHLESANDSTFVTGGVSDTYSDWRATTWGKGQIVLYNGNYYRALDNIELGEFNPDEWQKLSSLPVVGGVRATVRKRFTDNVVTVPYGTVYETVQDVVDFLLSYEKYLQTSGFEFNTFNKELELVANWLTSAKEFMFWTTQNWEVGSVITLSPSADRLVYNNKNAVIDNIFDPFYGNELFKADGTKLDRSTLSTYRQNSEFVIETKTNDGLYFCKLYPVQKEHVLVLDNRTKFKDYIYDPAMGYRQDRVKILGYRTSDWNGGFDIPGFVYDNIKVTSWESYKDYKIGDTIKFKEYYYVADKNITGTETFDASVWVQLSEAPTPKLKPNWDYRSAQFADFYDLDTDNFDAEQQKLAQHLIGYQPRKYLENIINDEVSQYKFYQGMIREKGTKNSLTKLFDSLGKSDKDSLKFYEEWAVRTGQYGAVDNFREVEYLIDEQKYILQPQPVKLTNLISASDTSLVYKIPEADVYTKPLDYNHSNSFVSKTDYSQFLKDAGYVAEEDVAFVIKEIDEILNLDFSQVTRSSYIWVSNNNGDWDILKPTKTELVIESITSEAREVTFDTNIQVTDIKVNDYIGVYGIVEDAGLINDDKIGRCFKVKKIQGSAITVDSIAQAPESITTGSAFIYKFVSYRTKDIETFNNNLNSNYLTTNDKVWIDSVDNSKWNVVSNTNPYYQHQEITTELTFKDVWVADTRYKRNDIVLFSGDRYIAINEVTSAVDPSADTTNWQLTEFVADGFGSKVVSGKKNQNVFVLAQDSYNGLGTIFYYQRNSETLNLTYMNKFEALEEYATNFKYDNIAVSDDEEIVVVSSSQASNVKTNYKGLFNESAPGGTYVEGDIVEYQDTLWKFNADYIDDASTLFTEVQDVVPVNNIPVESLGSTGYGTYSEQGVIFVYKKSGPRSYALVNSTISRRPQLSEFFGKEVVITQKDGTYELFVSAPGTNTNRIYFLKYDGENNILSYNEDRRYKGQFDENKSYRKGDIVQLLVEGQSAQQGQQLFVANNTLPAQTSFSLDNWELQDPDINYLEYVPNTLFPVLNDDSTVLSDEEKENFGDAFAVSSNGEVLAVGISNYAKYDNEATYLTGDIVSNNGKTYEAVSSVPPVVERIIYLDSAGISTKVDIAPGSILTQANTNATGVVKNLVVGSNRILLTEVSGVFDTQSGNEVTVTTTDSSQLEDAPSGRFIGEIVNIPNADTTNTSAWREIAAEKVAIYRKNNTRFALAQVINGTVENQGFGSKIEISDDGNTLLIGAPLADVNNYDDSGKIYVYKWQLQNWTLTQTIEAPQDLRNQKFGDKFSFNEDTLFVITEGTYKFDNEVTDITLDGNFTRFGEKSNNSTNLHVYDNLQGGLLYAGKIILDKVTNFIDYSVYAKNNHVYIGLPYAGPVNDYGKVFDIRRQINTTSWKVDKEQTDIIDTTKLKTVFAYNKDTKELISDIDYIDVLQGKIAAPLEQEINFKTHYDPAIYDIGNDSVVVDSNQSWAERYIGTVWWNLSSSKFYNPYQGDVLYKTNYWNKIFPGYNVEVCEWVESDYIPSQWDSLSGTSEGFAQGITGDTKYGDDVYATGRKYDPEAQAFTTKYYYWVAQKKTLPNNNPYRKLTAQEIALMIEDPAGQGYRFVALLDNDEFAMFNLKGLISGKTTALNFSYYVKDNINTNIHTQYKIFTDGLATSVPSNDLQEKWFDSLIGYDKFFRDVPNKDLSEKQKYGTLNTPRQSMFKNKFEARKQFFERVNYELNKRIILDDYDLSNLLLSDIEPDFKENKYDVVIDNNLQLETISLDNKTTAEISIELVDGKINKVKITNPGIGYVTAPSVTIGGDGQQAVLETEITDGKVTNVIIKNKGKNYNTISAVVRPYTVLIRADNTVENKWSLYSYDYVEFTWKRITGQQYDNTLYWSYKDWYAATVSELTSIDYVVENNYELELLSDKIGDIIKIQTIGTGGWLLLRKVDNTNTDTSIDYETIGRQNGTIEFNKSLWDYNQQQIGFDLESFDTQLYDNEPVRELRNILNALANNIFVDELRLEWNQLFLAGIRYVFTEQQYVDWAFKTSFVKAEHRLGEFEQKITFQNDNLSSYEDYVREVKPYKTKIREYLSTYEKVTNTNTLVTDFDLMPLFNPISGKIEPLNIKLQQGQIFVQEGKANSVNRNWANNVGFQVEEINVYDGGRGYTYTPKVTIESVSGTGAEARAIMRNGEILKIEVLKSGTGYLTQPQVVIEQPTGEDAINPVIVARIGTGLPRAFTNKIKFDRISALSDYDSISVVDETFTGVSNSQIYNLENSMDLNKANVLVKIDGIELLSSEYTFGNTTEVGTTTLRDTYDLTTGNNYYNNFNSLITSGTDVEHGFINLTNTPAQDSVITVSYKRSVDSLNVADRISNYYKPAVGMYGNELTQLMEGVDYGGVEVTSFNFETENIVGWDQGAWDTVAWSTYTETGDEFTFLSDGITTSFTLPEGSTLEQDVEYNVYINGVRIDAPDFVAGTPGTSATNENAIMLTITGNGTNVFEFPDAAEFQAYVSDKPDAEITLRKETFDGGTLPDETSYDTLLTGGDLAYASATGVASEDIVIDGDGFVTIATSAGPEEVVPGHVADTLDIRVYNRPDDGGNVITTRTYTYTDTSTFDIGLNPSSTEGFIVKINKIIVDSTNYTLDFAQRQVTITMPLSANDEVTIYSISGGASNILDVDNFIADGSTSEYITNVLYREDANALVTVNGTEVIFEIFKTDSSYGSEANLVGIRFGEAPVANDYIYFAIVAGTTIPHSQVKIQNFTGDGSSTQFLLEQLPYTLTTPVYTNTIINVGDVFLNQGYNKKFTVNNALNQYQLDVWQIPTGSFDIQSAKVFLNNRLLTYENEFLWDETTNIFSLISGTAQDGDDLKIFILGEEEFSIDTTNNLTTLVLGSAAALDTNIVVYSLGDDRTQLFERFHYDIAIDQSVSTDSAQFKLYQRLKSGKIKLRNKAASPDFVWVFVNGILQTPNLDYVLSEEMNEVIYKESLQLNDKIEILEFTTGGIGRRFGYRVFKDVTNKTIYKRLTDDRIYKVAKDFNFYDKTLELNTTAGLPTPSKDENIPGVVFIEGERIEYFIKLGNTLRQLRRGTRGTGVGELYTADTPVTDQSFIHTIPYNDNIEVVNETGDSTSYEYNLPYVPNVVSNTLNTSAWNRSTIPLTFGQCNEIEVFVGGKRLHKEPYTVYDVVTNTNITYEAEFSVNGYNYGTQDNPMGRVRLTNPAGDNTNVKIVRKIGKTWIKDGEKLSDANNLIARFIRSTTQGLPE